MRKCDAVDFRHADDATMWEGLNLRKICASLLSSRTTVDGPETFPFLPIVFAPITIKI